MPLPDLKRRPRPGFGGRAHHTGFPRRSPPSTGDYAEMAGIEFLLIDRDTVVAKSRRNCAGTKRTTSWRMGLKGLESGANNE